MRKVLLADRYPELAGELADQSLRDVLGVSPREKVRWRCSKGHEWDALVSNRVRKGYGCPYCSGRLPVPGENDLATLRPDLAAELVDVCLASTLKLTSHAKVRWRCGKGHEWEAPVSRRTADGAGCPYCSGRKAWPGETDLATTHPRLAEELVDVNLAKSLKAGTNRKVEWKCSECGHVWSASPNSRTHMGSGCPRCAGKLVVRGANDLASQMPALVAELVDAHGAEDIHVTSNKKVRWRCEKGHEWETLVSNRAQFGHGCPICAASRHASDEEEEFAAFVESVWPGEIVRNDRAVLGDRRELDVFVPDIRVAFEFNGVYWHSDAHGSAYLAKHVRKSEMAAKRGVRLIHVWEDDWRHRRQAVEILIRQTLGVDATVPGEVRLERLSRQEAKSWFDTSSLYIGVDVRDACALFDGDDVLAVLACHIEGDCLYVDAFWSNVDWVLAFERLFAFAVACTDTSSACAVTYDERDDGSYLQQLGFKKAGSLEGQVLVAGQCTGWKRVPEVDVSDDEPGDCHKLLGCGMTTWSLACV